MNSRGVLCGDVSGKLFAKTLRSATVPALVRLVGPMQPGGVPHGSTDYLVHAARAFLLHAQATGVSAALLFTDIHGALYAAAPEVVLGRVLTDPERETALLAAGLIPAEVDEFTAAFVHDAPLCDRIGVSDAQRRTLGNHRSWVALAGTDLRICPRIGTRPGDPLADVLFNSVFGVFQHFLTQVLRRHSLLPETVLRGTGLFCGQMSGRQRLDILAPTYMDDLVIPVASSEAPALLDQLRQAADIARQVAARLALALNFEPGKNRSHRATGGPWSDHAPPLARPGATAPK